MVHIGIDWDELLAEEFKQDYYLSLREFLKSEYSHARIYPPMHDIFNDRLEIEKLFYVISARFNGLGNANNVIFFWHVVHMSYVSCASVTRADENN